MDYLRNLFKSLVSNHCFPRSLLTSFNTSGYYTWGIILCLIGVAQLFGFFEKVRFLFSPLKTRNLKAMIQFWIKVWGEVGFFACRLHQVLIHYRHTTTLLPVSSRLFGSIFHPYTYYTDTWRRQLYELIQSIQCT
jgi:hypothetical protein